jgi:shikimate dehydrogenase
LVTIATHSIVVVSSPFVSTANDELVRTLNPGGRVHASGDETIVIGLIGAGIGASFSPALHEREASLLGFDYEYRLFDLDDLDRPPADAGQLVREARHDGFRGVNVTHPCKQLVIPELDELSPEAAALGAVNTIVFRAGRIVGHNTDCSGFREAFECRLPGARTGSVVLLGAGGAGAAVGHAILSSGARHVTVLDVERAEALADALAQRFHPRSATGADMSALEESLSDADGLIHATPTGMDAQPGTAVPAELLAPPLWVAEIVYMPPETQLLKDARERGCRTLDGGAMVALQAAGSLALFTGARPDRDRMLEHVDELIAETIQTA